MKVCPVTNCAVLDYMLAGITFTESCQPEFSVCLKSQLDQYISTLQSPTVAIAAKTTLACGRTLGSSNEILQHRLKNRKCKERKPLAVTISARSSVYLGY